ncbi:hypothetical protein SLS62_000461 [Diatrype stigma]|uniref:RNA-directed RNA polymerase n=1 Tax=Diatrype stigma TaxID=117547 RepID=A0AAN9YUG8_9PEZI
MDTNNFTLEKLSIDMVEEPNKEDRESVQDDEANLSARQQPEYPGEPNQLSKPDGKGTIDSPYTPHDTLLEGTQSVHSNDPNVTMIVATPSRRVWSLGSRYIVKEWICPHNDGNTEANATRLLRERGVDVPVPDILTSWKDKDWAFLISERLPGQPLMDVWPELSTEDRHRVAKQTADMVSKLRSITSNTCCAFDGGPIKDVNMLLATTTEGRRGSFGPLDSDAEVWEQMFQPRLDRQAKARGGDGDDDHVVVDEEHHSHRDLVRKYMPASGPPYVFTHGDLAFSNVLVAVDRDRDRDGNGKSANVSVSGVLDFEFSAYLPVWWEYVAAHFSSCRGDEEWKELLRQYLEPHEQAIDWYLYWAELCKTPLPEDVGVWAQILAKHERAS